MVFSSLQNILPVSLSTAGKESFTGYYTEQVFKRRVYQVRHRFRKEDYSHSGRRQFGVYEQSGEKK
jgi:hypothetical protein